MSSGMPSVRPSVRRLPVRPLTPISRDAIYLYSVEGFERVLAEILVM